MAQLTLAQVASLARRLGHDNLRVIAMRHGKWRAECSCGLRSSARMSSAEAAQVAANHVQGVADKFVRSQRAAGRDVEALLASVTADSDHPTREPLASA